MKKIIIAVVVAISFASCQQNKNTSTVEDTTSAVVAAPDAAVLTFEKASYDFGQIKQGEKVRYDFKFKNTGKTPLIISNATATCGCTTPDIPKEPISPGKEAVIKVVFDSTGKMGKQDKVVTVTSNGNPSVSQVHLIGSVNQS